MGGSSAGGASVGGLLDSGVGASVSAGAASSGSVGGSTCSMWEQTMALFLVFFIAFTIFSGSADPTIVIFCRGKSI